MGAGLRAVQEPAKPTGERGVQIQRIWRICQEGKLRQTSRQSRRELGKSCLPRDPPGTLLALSSAASQHGCQDTLPAPMLCVTSLRHSRWSLAKLRILVQKFYLGCEYTRCLPKSVNLISLRLGAMCETRKKRKENPTKGSDFSTNLNTGPI